jgi:hypothetical protein
LVTENASTEESKAVETSEETQEQSAEETPSEPQSLEALLAERSDLREHIAKAEGDAAQTGENRGKQRLRAEQRRQYRDPDAAASALLEIAKDGFSTGEVTQSMKDRANTLIAVAAQATADRIGEEIPTFFMNDVQYAQDTLTAYQEQIASGDTDGALKTLFEGALALKQSALESGFDQRVETAAKELAKKELDAASENGTQPIPATTRGNATTNTGLSLTTAELKLFPSAKWRGLDDEVKTQIYSAVGQADKERGEESVDIGRVERIAALAK